MKIAVIGMKGSDSFICTGEVMSETFPDEQDSINHGVLNVRLIKVSKKLQKLGLEQDDIQSFDKNLYKFKKVVRCDQEKFREEFLKDLS